MVAARSASVMAFPSGLTVFEDPSNMIDPAPQCQRSSLLRRPRCCFADMRKHSEGAVAERHSCETAGLPPWRTPNKLQPFFSSAFGMTDDLLGLHFFRLLSAARSRDHV